MESITLSPHLEENILSLLVFNTDQALLLSTMIKPAYFTTDLYKLIADQALVYIEQYKKAPEIHIADLLVGEIEKYPELNQMLHNLQKLSKKVHVDFVLTEVRELIKLHNIRVTLTQAVQALQGRNLAGVEEILEKRRKEDFHLFDPGINFGDFDSVMASLEKKEYHVIPCDIEVLDKFRIGLQAGTLLLFVAPAGKGKSWALQHFGQAALYHGKTVLHITLENSRELTLKRYMQSILNMTRDELSHINVPVLSKGEENVLLDIHHDSIKFDSLKGLDRDTLKMKLVKNFNRYAKNLWIKKFPMGYLSLSELKGYLLGMARTQNFVPDVLILDYAEHLKLNKDNLRIEIGDMYKHLRGMAEEMGFALVTASQSNRKSLSAKSTRTENLSEDISKSHIADTIITYSQTDAEHDMGTARLRVEKARDNFSGFEFVITQSYASGQFCLDSAMLGSSYWDFLK